MRWWAAAVLAMIVPLAWCGGDEGPALRFATFNIEDFPKHRRQIDAAFAEIKALDAEFIAVQEIREPELFLRELRRRFGGRWDFAHLDTRPIGETRRGHHIGVMYDTMRWELVGTRVHQATRLDGGRHKPVLEVRLQGERVTVRVLVVHLKSGSDGRAIRARQYTALAQIVRDVKRAGERIVVLGDFNATELGDRDDLARLAKDTGLVWATESLACSAFWSRDDGCPRSRLDHVLAWSKPLGVRAAGACATEGCDWQASCPTYAQHVSDHCPVVVDAP
jgi:endonuclease/exonuclease/phosphatase family metal-dependent hydrolase